jgi:hypothetical protein
MQKDFTTNYFILVIFFDSETGIKNSSKDSSGSDGRNRLWKDLISEIFVPSRRSRFQTHGLSFWYNGTKYPFF